MTRPTNHLAGQTSPYLLQHVRNPVDWHPWGREAIERARAEDKPIFLSIGYAACHWCHVMERESFENERIAAYLNEHFVSIKVDREERPDLDEIYMSAVQLMNDGQGGWPMSVFLTPELEPFFGGTYFPPDGRMGRIGFGELLERIREAWTTRRDALVRQASELTAAIRRMTSSDEAEHAEMPHDGDRVRAVEELAARFDTVRGGFGPAPKFPPDQALALLLREHVRTGEPAPLRMATTTLDAMAAGGLYDHVGGGFARYAVDDRWLVPHFEKMLYNQALLVPVYADAWLVTGRGAYRRVVAETTDFVRREMTHVDGGLLSSLDADSEGEEGRFYVWTPSEVRDVLGEADARRFCDAYDITEAGNFEGRSIPNRLASADGGADGVDDGLAPLRARLLERRDRRVRPGTDDKILTAWNGLMITAFARAAQVFGRDADVASARRAAGFVLDRLRVDGRLRVTWRDGVAALNAYLDDHAFLARGLLDLYETTFERRWLDAAEDVATTLLDRFEDRERGGFWFVSDDHESLIARTRAVHDGALPSGSAVACETLSRLGRHLGADRFRRAARRGMAAAGDGIRRVASAHAATLIAAEHESDAAREIAVVGAPDDPRTDALIDVARRRLRPPRIVALGDGDDDHPLLRGRARTDGAVAYVCREFACEAPEADPARLSERLDRI